MLKFLKQYSEQIIATIVAIIQTLFVWKTLEANGNMVIYIFIFMAFFFLARKTMQIKDKRIWVTSAVFSLLFTIVQTISASINIDYTLDHIITKRMFVVIPGYFFSALEASAILYDWINKLNAKKHIEGKILTKSLKWFLIVMLLILLAYLPYFLKYFPGLTTADSMDQIYQTIGYNSLRDNHPIVHTLLVSIFMNLGKLIGNWTFGVASYVIFQMIAMAAIFSYVVYYMAKKEFPLAVRVLTALYFMLYPVNALFSLILWKDILFGGIILLLTTFTYEFVKENKQKDYKFLCLYTLVILATTLFRNNGLYVVILMFIIMIIALKKNWKEILFTFGVALILSFGIKGILLNAFNAEKGPAKEALSIPMQQIARVVKYHNEELSDEEKEQIHNFIPASNIADLYKPVIADPIKREFDNDYFLEHKGEFIGLWAKLLVRYPKEYFEAFFSNNYGYYYPDVSYWVANRTMEQDDILHLQSIPLIQGKLIGKIDSLIENRTVPILSMVFSIGFVFWLIAFSASYIIYKKKYKLLLVYLPVLLLWFTTLASPVFCEFRYVYGMFTSLPMLIALIFEKEKQ